MIENIHKAVLSVEYFAGFFDGEGSIGLYYQRCSLPQPVASISNTNSSILFAIQKTLDLWDIKYRLFPVKRKKLSHKNSYTVQITGAKPIISLLEILIPSLKVKQQQAELLIDYLKRRKAVSHHPTKAFKEFAKERAAEIKALK